MSCLHIKCFWNFATFSQKIRISKQKKIAWFLNWFIAIIGTYLKEIKSYFVCIMSKRSKLSVACIFFVYKCPTWWKKPKKCQFFKSVLFEIKTYYDFNLQKIMMFGPWSRVSTMDFSYSLSPKFLLLWSLSQGWAWSMQRKVKFSHQKVFQLYIIMFLLKKTKISYQAFGKMSVS